jgi:hypothetical protein
MVFSFLDHPLYYRDQLPTGKIGYRTSVADGSRVAYGILEIEVGVRIYVTSGDGEAIYIVTLASDDWYGGPDGLVFGNADTNDLRSVDRLAIWTFFTNTPVEENGGVSWPV